MIVMMSVVCSCINGSNKNQAQTTTDSSIIEESTGVDVSAAKQFLVSMYKELYEPYNKDRTEKHVLSKYFTEEAMQKFYVESAYDGEEGCFFYCTDFLIDGSISGDASPDYGDKVVSRTIEHESDDWFLVTNIWDVIKDPVKVHLQVKRVNGAYKIVDLRLNDNQETSEVVKEESSSNQVPTDKFVGKYYVGNGYFAGMGTSMAISFKENQRCTCYSDFNQNYPNKKFVDGTYRLKDNYVIVIVKIDGDDWDYKFQIADGGRKIGYDYSAPNGGKMDMNFLTLEQVDVDAYSKATK